MYSLTTVCSNIHLKSYGQCRSKLWLIMFGG